MNTKKIALALLTLGAWLLLPASGASAVGPEWSFSVTSFPNSFLDGASGSTLEGPSYRLLATNTGDSPTTAPYTLTDTVAAPELSIAAGTFGKDQKGNSLSCEVSGQTVTCTGTEPIGPGEKVEVRIPVNVAPGNAGKSVSNEARIEGGGAASVSDTTNTAIGVPAWQLTAIPAPTNFAPGASGDLQNGPQYVLIATNIGGAPTSGPIVLEATLPDGVTPTSVDGTYEDPESAKPSCEIVVQTVTCKTVGPIHPGRWLGAKITVDVALDPEGTLSAAASVSGGGAATATTTAPMQISAQAPNFDFLSGPAGLGALLTNADGSPATQAGSHPSQFTVNLGFPSEKIEELLIPTGHLRDQRVELPRGLVVNPAATPVLCTEAQLSSQLNPGCPAASQVGTVSIMTILGGVVYSTEPLYNMVPPPGVPAALAFDAVGGGVFIHIMGGVRSDGDFGLTANVNDLIAPPNNPILSVQAQLWGDPSSSSHDQIRSYQCLGNGGSCEVEPQKTAMLTMPSQCTGPIVTSTSIATWEEPDDFKERSFESTDLGGNLVGVEGCNQLAYEPTVESKPTTNLADSPSGLDFHLHQPQNFDLEGLSTAALKDATVTLPEGMVVNPSQADGLEVCTSAQIGLTSPIGQSPIRINKVPDSCPDAAKIGTVQVKTPLLAQIDDATNKFLKDPEGNAIPRPLEGSVYLAKPFDNPFDSLIAIYFSIEDPKSGIVVKLAGEVKADPQTGQLSTVFPENPQLPIEDVELHLFKGPRAALRTPPNCAIHATTTTMRPWSTPEGKDAHPSDAFAISAAPNGGACPSSAQGAPHSPTLSAGTLAPQAGAFSPFVLKVTRNDASQNLARIEGTLPPGLIGKLAGVPMCSEAQIAQAKARNKPNEGAIERANPSCPAASEVGNVTVAAGAGITPIYVGGRAYLAGPYKGAPLSVLVITPAVAGPFDIGSVVVRAALYVDPRSAQIRAVADPLPTIIEGIPLDVRSVSVKMDRPNFTLNPTSCDPMAVEATIASVFEQSAALKSPFQVGGCTDLGFKPKLSLRLKGGTKRGDNPKLIATLAPRPGDANIARAQVTLPRSAFLDQAHIRTICTRVQFAAEQCPKGSIYGYAKGTSPLIDYPVQGPVYLRSSDNPLPDLVADLRGPAQQPVRFELIGRTDSVKGALRNTFDVVPDAPVSAFRLELFGGKRGLVVNSSDLCKKDNRAIVKFDAHNGKVYDFKPKLKSSCKKAKRKGKKRR